MPEQIEILVAQAMPHLDRSQPPPGYQPIETVTVPCDNPRGNHAVRHAAARRAMAFWAKEHHARVRSLSPRPLDGGGIGFLAVLEIHAPPPRLRAVSRDGIHASRNHLVKR